MGFQLEKNVSWTFDKMPVLPHYWCTVFCTCMSGQMQLSEEAILTKITL